MQLFSDEQPPDYSSLGVYSKPFGPISNPNSILQGLNQTIYTNAFNKLMMLFHLEQDYPGLTRDDSKFKQTLEKVEE